MSAILQEHLNIRKMQESDIGVVLVIEKAAHLSPWTEGIFRDCLRVGYLGYVLEENQEIVAYGMMSVAAREAHIFNICVLPERQGEGLGRLMMNYMLEQAERLKAKTVFLEVRPSNIKAIQLYEALDFSEVGVRKQYYPAKNGREDALILAKAIGDDSDI